MQMFTEEISSEQPAIIHCYLSLINSLKADCFRASKKYSLLHV